MWGNQKVLFGKSTNLLLFCYALTCGSNRVATFQTFRMDYCMPDSDWLSCLADWQPGYLYGSMKKKYSNGKMLVKQPLENKCENTSQWQTTWGKILWHREVRKTQANDKSTSNWNQPAVQLQVKQHSLLKKWRLFAGTVICFQSSCDALRGRKIKIQVSLVFCSSCCNDGGFTTNTSCTTSKMFHYFYFFLATVSFMNNQTTNRKDNINTFTPSFTDENGFHKREHRRSV